MKSSNIYNWGEDASINFGKSCFNIDSRLFQSPNIFQGTVMSNSLTVSYYIMIYNPLIGPL